MTIRKATHAGTWYPGTKESLKSQMSKLFKDNKYGPGELPSSENKSKRTILGGLSPHAGYRYSGYCAAHTYLNLFQEKIPDSVIILGTIHQNYNDVSLFESGEWETPLGNLEIDSELSKLILTNSQIIQSDESAFTGYYLDEHNIEIQLPFIKYCAGDKDVKILPIKLGAKAYHNFDVCSEIANDLANSINSYDKDVIIIASSDMQHEEVLNEKKLEKFKERDHKVIEAFKALDGKSLMKSASNLSICGPQTQTTLVLTSKYLGAKRGKLLKYYTSVDKEGFGYCVGYFSGIIVK